MRTRQKCVATDTWRSLGCRTTPLEHWSRRKPTVEPRWAKQQTKKLRPKPTKINSFMSGPSLSLTPDPPASPDGRVHTACGKRLLEFKCPYKWRYCKPEEAANDPQFCCKFASGKLKLKENHSYYYQVQGQLAIAGISGVIFLSGP